MASTGRSEAIGRTAHRVLPLRFCLTCRSSCRGPHGDALRPPAVADILAAVPGYAPGVEQYLPLVNHLKLIRYSVRLPVQSKSTARPAKRNTGIRNACAPAESLDVAGRAAFRIGADVIGIVGLIAACDRQQNNEYQRCGQQPWPQAGATPNGESLHPSSGVLAPSRRRPADSRAAGHHRARHREVPRSASARQAVVQMRHPWRPVSQRPAGNRHRFGAQCCHVTPTMYRYILPPMTGMDTPLSSTQSLMYSQRTCGRAS